MTFRFVVETGNSAFAAPGGEPSRVWRNRETLRLLRLAADRLARGEEHGVLLDLNGNTVGWFEFEGPAPDPAEGLSSGD